MIITLASILLLLRLWGTAYFVSVIRTQRILMKRPIDAEVTGFRRNIHLLTVLLAVSVLAPIVFDSFIILKDLGIISTNVRTFPVMALYAFSNALTFLLTGFLFHKIYDSALQLDESHPSDHTLMNNQDR